MSGLYTVVTLFYMFYDIYPHFYVKLQLLHTHFLDDMDATKILFPYLV